MAKIHSFRDLIVYQRAYKLAMEIYSKLMSGYDEIRKMHISMMNSPEKFCK
jgi:hypothetical protein